VPINAQNFHDNRSWKKLSPSPVKI